MIIKMTTPKYNAKHSKFVKAESVGSGIPGYNYEKCMEIYDSIEFCSTTPVLYEGPNTCPCPSSSSNSQKMGTIDPTNPANCLGCD